MYKHNNQKIIKYILLIYFICGLNFGFFFTPFDSNVIQMPKQLFAQVNSFKFEHVVIDSDPLATYRINDIQIGDINQDGLLDIWTSGRGSGSDAYQMVWYKNFDWTRYPIATGDYKYGNLGDFDGDGDLDIVVDQYWFEHPGNAQLSDWPKHDLGYTDQPDLIFVEDINEDGLSDLVYMTKNKVAWVTVSSQPKEPWKSYIIWSGGIRTGGALVDIDMDGDIDVLYGNAWFENPIDPTNIPWPMHMIDDSWPSEAKGEVADLNGDGRPDIILTGEESNDGIAWYESPLQPKTETWTKHIISSSYSGVHSCQVADFNQDGKLDIFAAEMHTQGEHRVTIFENIDVSNNIWFEHVIAYTGSHNAKIADINGDGWPDIVGKNYQGSSIAPLQVDIWLNKIRSPFDMNSWQRYIIDNNAQIKAIFVDG